MKKIVLFLIVNLTGLTASAQALNIISCLTNGFAYNNIDVVTDHSNLHFTTNGHSLFVSSDKLGEKQRVRQVRFSIPASQCTLDDIKDNEMTCSVQKLPIEMEVYESGISDPTFISDEINYASLILKKVSNQYTGIKLLVLETTIQEKLKISNGFNTCL